ncbi:hypothetical protein [Methylocapsa acidiphila]|uniref:hypothetical protein n=1 Tax=Methylocapsa acidiphila TaxID=133552 RepID=UPI0012EC3914|nr:hypothetical protein [Methylocapsa acidiphila]
MAQTPQDVFDEFARFMRSNSGPEFVHTKFVRVRFSDTPIEALLEAVEALISSSRGPRISVEYEGPDTCTDYPEWGDDLSAAGIVAEIRRARAHVEKVAPDRLRPALDLGFEGLEGLTRCWSDFGDAAVLEQGDPLAGKVPVHTSGEELDFAAADLAFSTAAAKVFRAELEFLLNAQAMEGLRDDLEAARAAAVFNIHKLQDVQVVSLARRVNAASPTPTPPQSNADRGDNVVELRR